MPGTLYRQTHNTCDLLRGTRERKNYSIETTEGYFEVGLGKRSEGITLQMKNKVSYINLSHLMSNVL